MVTNIPGGEGNMASGHEVIQYQGKPEPPSKVNHRQALRVYNDNAHIGIIVVVCMCGA